MFAMRYKEIGLKIAYYRKKKGLTQTQLAEKVGKSTNYIGLLERGNNGKSFSVGTLFTISQALEVEPKELLSANL